MTISRHISHFDRVDKAAIEAVFFDQRRHRASLRLPFIDRTTNRTLCVIGQNPSAADDLKADKTIRYLEELIYRTCPEYAALLVLNLYSRVDTKKNEKDGLLHPSCAEVFDKAVRDHQDFLLIYGKLRNQGAYKFPERADQVRFALKTKNVLKLDLATTYPPHPGNAKIVYTNFKIKLARLHRNDD